MSIFKFSEMTGGVEATTVLPVPPDDSEMVSYAWRSLPFLVGAMTVSALSVVAALLWFELRDWRELPYMVIPALVYTLVFLVYQALSIPMNFAGKQFDMAEHEAIVDAWIPLVYPQVDVFLPICGEELELLRNTWIGVLEMLNEYPGDSEAFVLDDGDSDEAKRMAAEFEFSYIRRPVHEFKKAGNLNYAFARTGREHIVVFDADFRPRSDFLGHTMPYMDDQATGIVQTPQYFRVDNAQTWVERAASATLEVFYRVVQVGRDAFDSALCVGSNAVYRRTSLEPQGGFTLIPYAEDSHTGLDARRNGFGLTYIPVNLATGVCPSVLDTYMRQQYRWCCGSTSLVWSRRMWSVSMPLKSRLPYISGWLWNLSTALRTLLIPLLPVGMLLLAPGQIQPKNALLLLPTFITSMVLFPLWHYAPYSPRIWSLTIATGWAQILAIWDYSRGKVMSWSPTRGPGGATRRFWRGVTVWNGTLAFSWVGLAVWRTSQTGSVRFVVVLALGLMNLYIVARLIFPGRSQPSSRIKPLSGPAAASATA